MQLYFRVVLAICLFLLLFIFYINIYWSWWKLKVRNIKCWMLSKVLRSFMFGMKIVRNLSFLDPTILLVVFVRINVFNLIDYKDKQSLFANVFVWTKTCWIMDKIYILMFRCKKSKLNLCMCVRVEIRLEEDRFEVQLKLMNISRQLLETKRFVWSSFIVLFSLFFFFKKNGMMFGNCVFFFSRKKCK